MILLLLGCLADLGPRSAQAHAGDCASCHDTHGDQFAGSAHAQAGTSALFQALRDDADARLGAAPLCDTCHRPAGDEGLDCLTCHTAIATVGQGEGGLLADPTGPVRGPSGGGDLAPHDVAESALLVSGDLCGTCHDVARPAGFAEDLFTAWQHSGTAQTCQDCHMGPIPGVAGDRTWGPAADVQGVPDRPLSDHAFAGMRTDPAALLSAAFVLEPGGRLVEVAGGHPAPGGFSAVRGVALVGWSSGEEVARVPLSSQLLAGDVEVVHPLDADTVVSRAVPVGGAVELGVDADEVCLEFTAVAPDLAALLDLPLAQAVDVLCAPGR